MKMFDRKWWLIETHKMFVFGCLALKEGEMHVWWRSQNIIALVAIFLTKIPKVADF